MYVRVCLCVCAWACACVRERECVYVCACVCELCLPALKRIQTQRRGKKMLTKTGVPNEIRRRHLSNKVPTITNTMSSLVDWHIDTSVSEEIAVWDRDRGIHRNVSNYVPKYTVSYSCTYSCTKQHASSLATPQLTTLLRVWSQVRRDRSCVWAQTMWTLLCLAAPRTYCSRHWDGLCAAETVCEVHAVKLPLMWAVKPLKCHSAAGVSNFTPRNLSKPKTYSMYHQL